MIKITTPHIGLEELNAVKEVLNSGYLVQNKKVTEFEQLLSNYIGTKYAIVVSSGTAALHLALLSLDIGADDEVIIPDFTFPATANAIELVGATPVIVDIELDSFCIDASQIESKITKKTKAIMPVHEFGYPADMDRILKIAKRYNLKVIEDAACALGSEYNGKKAGSLGDIGCFSLHPRKSITTGEGGIIVTNNVVLADKLRILRNHGIHSRDELTEIVMPGFNYRMTDIQAAIGIVQMSKLNKVIIKKRKLARLYNRVLNSEDIKTPSVERHIRHSYQSYHIVLNKTICRDSIIEKLRKNRIESNYGAYSIHCQLFYSNKYGYSIGQYANSYTCYRNGLVLPLSYSMDENDIKYIGKTLLELI